MVVANLAPGISYSENTQSEPESEEPHIVIHENTEIPSGRGSIGKPAGPANQDQKQNRTCCGDHRRDRDRRATACVVA